MTSADPVSSGTSTVGPPPPFDADLAAALRIIGKTIPPDGVRPETISATRQKAEANGSPSDEELARGGAFAVRELTVPGPAGSPDISLLICRPTTATTPTPAIYHIHGGGMLVGDCRMGLPPMLDLADEFGMAVVSVEYRLAPETPHPGPVEDCYAGLAWCAAHAGEQGIDPERIVLIGASAGGGLAAGVALMARDRGGPAVLGQLLMCPMLDDRNDTPSAVQMAGLGIWDRTCNETGWNALLGGARGTDDVSPYAAPARATDLSGLPPAFIDVGSAETFRDEDVMYASRIWQAGGSAELHVWPGGFHGFAGMAPQAAISRDAQAAPRQWLRRLLSNRMATA